MFNTCLLKADGNPESYTDYKYNSELKSNQVKEKIIQIARAVVKQAKENKANIVIENIDLGKKQFGYNKRINRKVSLITYRKFITYLKSCAVKNGVLVKETNPAYTSVIAKLKYAIPLGRSVHSCAAQVVGRRGQGYNEKVPSKIASLLRSGERAKHSWSQWNLLNKRPKKVLNRDSLVELRSFTNGTNDFWFLLTQSDGVRAVHL